MNAQPRKFQPIVPQTLADVEYLAKTAVKSGWRSEKDEAESEDKRIALATMIILQGLEVGLPPTQALQQIMVDDQGRFLIWGDAIPGLLWANGFKIEEWFDGAAGTDTYEARCAITRPDGTRIERKFSVREAKRARLWDDRPQVKGADGKLVDNNSMWFRYSDRLLQMRARGFCQKDGASDVTRGLYIREEYAPEYNSPIVRERDDVAKPMPKGPPPPPGATVEPTVEREPEAAGDTESLKEAEKEVHAAVAAAVEGLAASAMPRDAEPKKVAAPKAKPRPPRPPKPPGVAP